MDHVTGGVRFGVLGPLMVMVGGRDITPRAAHERSLLALLLTSPGRVFSVSEIVSALWGDAPPQRAERTVQVYVSRLRRSLGDPSLIITQAPGYQVAADPAAVDAARFEAATAQARAALRRHDPQRAAPLLRDALALWRGEPLADIPAPFAEAERARLDEMRLGAIADRVNADLALGLGPELVAELEVLTARYPLRERFWGQLMTALYRSGRQGDALAAYRRLRSLLIEDLGVEPGPEVRAIESMVLAQHPRLAAAPPATREVPAPLRTGDAIIAGRDRELAWLRAAFDRVLDGEIAWLALEGAHGSGRTRLVAELAGYAHDHGATVTYATGAEISAAWPPVERPALVVLDDLDQAPPEETERLAALAPQTPGRLLVVATYETDRLPTLAARLLRRVKTEVRKLAPLDDEQVAEVVRLYVDEADIPAAVAACTAAGALPLQVHRTASAWAERSAAAAVEHAVAEIPEPRRNLESARDRLLDGVIHLRQVRDRRRAQGGLPDGGRVICPYKGLAFFDRADSDFFFGRERLVAELVARLVEAPLLAVVGPSGSGKSSVVRAGLVEALAAGALPGSDGWAYRITTPTDGGWRPRDGVDDERPSLLVIDQLEEAFTALSDTDRDELLTCAVGAARDGSRCVLAVRADYFGHLARHPELARLMSTNAILVGPMTGEELREAIVRPAERAGLELDNGLADALVDEVAAEPGGLPLLSTALLGLWERREGRRLTVRAHLQAGGVSAAIRRLAEAAYRDLGPTRQPIARRILLRLADAGPGGDYVRRRAPIAEVALEGDTEARTVLDALADARLVSVDKSHVEVAHEALLREWPRLRAWLDEDEMGRRLRAHLAPAAADWTARGKDSAELYRGARLTAALDWASNHQADLSPAEREFLAAGHLLAEADAASRRRSVRRSRILAGAMAALFVLATIGGGVAAVQRARAEAAALAADVRSLRAHAASSDRWDLALLYAAQAQRLDPAPESRATLLTALQRSPEAIGVMRLANRPVGMALTADGSRLAVGDRGGDVEVWDTGTRHPLMTIHATRGLSNPVSIDFSPDGRRLAVVGEEYESDPQSNVSVTDLDDAHPEPTFLPAPRLSSAAFAVDGAALVASTLDGRLVYLDARTGDVLRTVGATAAGPAVRVQMSPDRAYLGVGFLGVDSEGPFGVWDLSSGRQIWSGSGRGIVAPGPGGRQAVVGTDQGIVEAVDLTTGARHAAGRVHTATVQSVVWRNDGGAFATTSDDRTAVVWDPSGLTPTARLAGQSGRVQGGRFTPDGRTLYTASLDSTVFVWDLGGGRRVARPVGPPPSVPVDELRAISGDGQLAVGLDLNPGTRGLEVTNLVAGNSFVLDGPEFAGGFDVSTDTRGDRIAVMAADARTGTATVRVLDVATRQLLPFAVPVDTAAADGQPHGALALGSDGRTVVIVNGPGVIQRWDVDSQTRLSEVRPPLPGIKPWIRLDPSGKLGALVLGDVASGAVAVVDVRTGRILAQLASADYRPPVFSPDGRLLAAGTYAGEILLWDTRSWKLLHRWHAHDGFTATVAFTPDSRYVVSGGTDGKAGLWDVRDPTSGFVVVDVGHSGTSWVLVGTTRTGDLVTVPNAGPPLRWDIAGDHLAHRACDIVRRNLTTEEWAAVLPDRPYEHTCPA